MKDKRKYWTKNKKTEDNWLWNLFRSPEKNILLNLCLNYPKLQNSRKGLSLECKGNFLVCVYNPTIK